MDHAALAALRLGRRCQCTVAVCSRWSKRCFAGRVVGARAQAARLAAQPRRWRSRARRLWLFSPRKSGASRPYGGRGGRCSEGARVHLCQYGGKARVRHYYKLSSPTDRLRYSSPAAQPTTRASMPRRRHMLSVTLINAYNIEYHAPSKPPPPTLQLPSSSTPPSIFEMDGRAQDADVLGGGFVVGRGASAPWERQRASRTHLLRGLHRAEIRPARGLARAPRPLAPLRRAHRSIGVIDDGVRAKRGSRASRSHPRPSP